MGSPLHCPLSCPLFSHLEVVGCALSCPLFPYMEVVGSLICMVKFPLAAHEQPTPLPNELPTVSIYGSSGQPTELLTVSIYGSSGQPTELHTELPTVSIYGSSGQPNLHGKIPMGSPRAAHSVAHVQPTGSEVGSSPVFSVWVTFYYKLHIEFDCCQLPFVLVGVIPILQLRLLQIYSFPCAGTYPDDFLYRTFLFMNIKSSSNTATFLLLFGNFEC